MFLEEASRFNFASQSWRPELYITGRRRKSCAKNTLHFNSCWITAVPSAWTFMSCLWIMLHAVSSLGDAERVRVAAGAAGKWDGAPQQGLTHLSGLDNSLYFGPWRWPKYSCQISCFFFSFGTKLYEPKTSPCSHVSSTLHFSSHSQSAAGLRCLSGEKSRQSWERRCDGSPPTAA